MDDNLKDINEGFVLLVHHLLVCKRVVDAPHRVYVKNG